MYFFLHRRPVIIPLYLYSSIKSWMTLLSNNRLRDMPNDISLATTSMYDNFSLSW